MRGEHFPRGGIAHPPFIYCMLKSLTMGVANIKIPPPLISIHVSLQCRFLYIYPSGSVFYINPVSDLNLDIAFWSKKFVIFVIHPSIIRN